MAVLSELNGDRLNMFLVRTPPFLKVGIQNCIYRVNLSCEGVSRQVGLLLKGQLVVIVNDDLNKSRLANVLKESHGCDTVFIWLVMLLLRL
jgi:hypothetical protein